MADFDNLAKSLEDQLYVAVGLGVLGFQRAQVRRVELQQKVGHLGGLAQGALSQLGREVTERSAPARQSAGDLASEAVAHLPEPARDLLGAMGNLVTGLPSEAKGLTGELLALGRFVLHAASAPASRYASRQGA